jgi:hypothetical protein
MRGSIPPLPQLRLMMWCSVKEKHRGNCTSTLPGIFVNMVAEGEKFKFRLQRMNHSETGARVFQYDATLLDCMKDGNGACRAVCWPELSPSNLRGRGPHSHSLLWRQQPPLVKEL